MQRLRALAEGRVPVDLSIQEVNTLRDQRAFVRFPNKLYKGSPYWVPALFVEEYQMFRRDRNPAFDSCEARYWLARRGREIVGRIAAI